MVVVVAVYSAPGMGIHGHVAGYAHGNNSKQENALSVLLLPLMPNVIEAVMLKDLLKDFISFK